MSVNNQFKQRIAMVGLGDIAQKAYLPIISQHLNIQPVLCSRNESTVKYLADKYRISEVYTDYKRLLQSKPDAIMIHSATESHYQLAKLALEYKIPVYVDKPLSDNLQQVESLIALAKQQNVLIYVGFNRRFAPLVQTISSSLSAMSNTNKSITLQKDRFNLPALASTFIYDDFIHVIDTVRYLERPNSGYPETIHVAAQFELGLLANLQVSWQSQYNIVNANMNRIAGVTQERLQVNCDGNSWQVDNLREGHLYQQQKYSLLGFSDWENTLYKRGFVNLIDDWLKQLEIGCFNKEIAEDILFTHKICDQVLGQLN
tara:strand:+ start:4743 stop:5690 length:948 start_codon:yes stop_codon:yes gene_type:complete